MAIKSNLITTLCLFVAVLAGCLKEIAVEESLPSKEALPPEIPTLPAKPPEPSPRVQASLKLTDQGRRHLKEDNADNAIRIFEQAISLNPNNGQNYYYLSEAWLMKKFVTKARRFNQLAESHLDNDGDWGMRVVQQANRITELEIKIKQSR